MDFSASARRPGSPRVWPRVALYVTVVAATVAGVTLWAGLRWLDERAYQAWRTHRSRAGGPYLAQESRYEQSRAGGSVLASC